MEKTDQSKIAKPFLVMTGITIFLLILGVGGFGAIILDITGQITPGTTLSEKFENGSKGMDLITTIACIAFLAGVLASSYLYILSRFAKKK